MSEIQTPSVALARYACEFCKRKKIKCSRELPKCAACKPWSGSCNYYRQFPETILLKPSANGQDSDPNSLTTRLDKIEARLETLTSAIDKLLFIAESQSSQFAPDQPATAAPSIPPHSFSSLAEANLHLTSTSDRKETPLDYEVAAENLQDLTDALTSFRLDVSVNLSDASTAIHREYLVPSQDIGYHVMSKFRSLAQVTKAFFQIPSEDLLHQIIFSPSEAPPGWVIFVNYYLLATPATSTDPGLVIMWRWNVRLALQNASLYLVPSHINVNAFMLLSFHGEDFAASPNSSWMLSSQTCLQAKALTLHHPAPGLEYDDRQRQLCQFWSLFNLEKQCALAFGRPSLLPTYQYCHVEMPSFEYLCQFRPCLNNVFEPAESPTSSTFGAHIFLWNIELAKHTGMIMDFLSSGNDSHVGREALRRQLDGWYQQTNKTFTFSLDSSDPSRNRLFQFTIKFRYLHMLIILLPKDSSLRISSAREAIQILLATITTWDPIYNGVIWHLLYYPFTPFFVVFGHIINNSESPDVQKDLELLGSVVGYFGDIQTRLTLLGELTLRLQRTAEVFYRLALKHTGRRSSVSYYPPAKRQFRQQELGSENNIAWTGDEFSFDDVDIDKLMSWVPEDIVVPEGFNSGIWNDSTTAVQGEGIKETSSSAQGQKRPFETAFDWFSWESYNWDV
ncbi:hypothetical protein QBC44DRAFT_334717 [Cladorrhinum sp. PSN332]|nr:hypothetical protein QBC44DRAFT_334717 [Cladorrhinum sp. PSN332]